MRRMRVALALAVLAFSVHEGAALGKRWRRLSLDLRARAALIPVLPVLPLPEEPRLTSSDSDSESNSESDREAPDSPKRKFLYLMRHGESKWNAASGWEKFKGAFQDKHSGSPLIDASLTKRGIAEALLLCANSYLHASIERPPTSAHRCLTVAKLLFPPILDNIHLNRQKLDEEAMEGFNHADVLTGLLDPSLVAHVTSPLVRAIETFYFATQPAQPIATFMSTDIQEIGKGYDGNIHEKRRFNGVDKAILPNGVVGNLKQPTDEQLRVMGKQAKKFSAFESMLGGTHASFWKMSEVFPTRNTYREVYGESPKRPFDANPFRWQSDQLKEGKRQDPKIYHRMMASFLDFASALPQELVVVAGHSHFFGHLLHDFSAPHDDVCKGFGHAMQNNGAVWRVELVDNVDGARGGPRIGVSNCEMIYGRFKNPVSGKAKESFESQGQPAAGKSALQKACKG